MTTQAINLTLVEPVIFLRSLKDAFGGDDDISDDSASRARQEEHLNQLRGLVTLNRSLLPSVSSTLKIALHGLSVWVDWIDNQPKNRQREILNRIVEIELDTSEDTHNLTIPFSIPVPTDLPPSVDADFGANKYAVSATVEAIRPSKPIVSVEKNIRLVASAGQVQDVGSSRGEGNCFEDRVRYAWTTDSRLYIGAPFSMSLSILPQSDKLVSVTSIGVLLEEVTLCGDKSLSLKPVVRTYSLLKLLPSLSTQTLLPWIRSSDDRDRDIDDKMTTAARRSMTEKRSTSTEKIALQTLDDDCVIQHLNSETGPWNLSWIINAPMCTKSPINPTVHHDKGAVDISHRLVLEMSFKGSVHVAKVIQPVRLLSAYLAESGSTLPCYWCATLQDHPYSANETWRRLEDEEVKISSPKLPTWLSRLLGKKHESSAAHLQEVDPSQNSKEWLELSSQKGIPTYLGSIV